MITKIGYIPYLNMIPFHQGFGPQPMEIQGQYFEFVTMSPRVLGQEAEKGTVDAGAISLVDAFRLASTYESLGPFGIGLKRPALSVLLFSKKPISDFEGLCAVTDETSTSLKLLQVLFEIKHGRTNVQFSRIPSPVLFDGQAEGLLLIGDEALKARKVGIPGLPVMTDLGEEWYGWQGTPFVFARWMVKKTMDPRIKHLISQCIQNSLYSNKTGTSEQLNYWHGFHYKLRPEHERSVSRFARLMDKVPAARSPEGRADLPMAVATEMKEDGEGV